MKCHFAASMADRFAWRLLVLSVASGLSVLSAAEAAEQEPEHIEVRGISLNSGLMLQTKEPWDTSPDLSQSLERLPGLSLNSNGPISSIAQYRGVFGDRVLVRIDGAQIAGAGPNAMDSPLSHLVLAAHSQVTVYRGITPVSVGGDALNGAIVTQHLDGFSESSQWQWQGEIQATASNNGDRRHVSGDVTLSHGDMYFRGGVQDQKGKVQKDGNGRRIPSGQYDRDGYRLQGGWRSGAHEVQLSFSSQDTNNTGTAALAMDIDFINADWYRADYRFHPSKGAQWHLKLYGNDNQHGMSNFTQRRIMMPSMARTNTVDSRGRGIELDRRESWSKGSYTLGLDWFEGRHNSRITNPNNGLFFIQNYHQVKRERRSGFVEIEQKESKDWEWLSGLRFSKIQSRAGQVSTNMAMMNPRVAEVAQAMNKSARDQSYTLVDITTQLRYRQQTDLYWVLGLARKQRAPSYTELFSWFPLGVSAGLADGKNYIGNQQLKKESAIQLDAGIDYSALGWVIAPRVFYHKVDNYIQGLPSQNSAANAISMMMGAGRPLQWSNTDATLYGADMQFSYRYDPHWQYDNTVSYVRGKRDDIDDDLYRIAPLSLRQQLQWHNQQWRASLEWLLVSKQSRVSKIQSESETAGYGLINLDLQYQWSNNLSAAIRIDNLFDKQYSRHLAGVNRVRAAEIAVGEKLPASGRTLYLSLRYNFGH